MAFTSWADLKTAIQDDLADNVHRVLTQQYSTPNGHQISFRSLKQVQDFLDWIDKQIDAESGGMAINLARFGT